jgi:hypothetical protein
MKKIRYLLLLLAIISVNCFAFTFDLRTPGGQHVALDGTLLPISGGTGTADLVNSAVVCSDSFGDTAWCTTLPTGLTIPGYPLDDGTNATGTWNINITGSAVIANGSIANAKLINSSVTLSAGNGISISGSPVSLGGTATISLASGINNTVLNTTGGASGTMVVGTKYLLNSGNAVTYSFPATCPLGSVISVINYGSTSLQITLQTGQIATHPNGSSSSGGSINITANTAFEMTCLSNSAVWIDKMNGGVVNLL